MAEPATVLQLLPKLDIGGAERVAIEIAEALHHAGHRALIACEGGALTQAALRAGAEILPLPLDTKSPIGMRRNAARLKRVIRENRVDLVHAHSRAPAWSGYWATRGSAVRFVTTCHGLYTENLPLKRRYNAVMARGERVIAVSRFIGDLFSTRYPDTTEKLRVIPGGVDPAKFDPAEVKGDRAVRLARAWRLKLGAPNIMLPGRLSSWKGHRLLISALARMRHRDALVVLAGGDQGRERYTRSLIAHAAALGVADRLRLTGNVEDMPAALLLADVVVNASTDPEPFGRTIIEAQAMARMVVAADHGGPRETVLHGETGLLFPPGDVDALAAAIDDVLDLPVEERIARGKHAREIVSSRFSVANMQESVLSIYDDLLRATALP